MASSSVPKRPYLYAVKPSSETPVVTGQLEAENMESVRVGLAKLLGCRHLPEQTIIMDKADVDEEGEKAWQFVRNMFNDGDWHGEARAGNQGASRDRRPAPDRSDAVEAPHPNWKNILRILTLHNEWLSDPDTGERAYLAGMSLTGINLSGRVLSQAHMANVDLSGADLSGAVLTGVNLAGANLRGADMRGADLENADLSEVDLRDAVLLDANLKGADLWRANIRGAVIKARALHQAFECRTK